MPTDSLKKYKRRLDAAKGVLFMNNYYRITAYNPKADYSLIIDSYGKFDKLWQFSSFLVQKGLKVLEVTKEENLIDGNIPKASLAYNKLILCACAKGKPDYITEAETKTIQVANRYYSIG